MLNSRNRVLNQHFLIFNMYLSNVKLFFADNCRAEPTTFTTEKLFFETFSGHSMSNPSLRLFENK